MSKRKDLRNIYSEALESSNARNMLLRCVRMDETHRECLSITKHICGQIKFIQFGTEAETTIRKLIEICDQNSGRLLREHRFFAVHAFMRKASS